jgi:hypothetical protein
MFKVKEMGGIGAMTIIATFQTFDEAERYVLEREIVCYERDADNPGCADAFLRDGRLWAIEADRTPAAASDDEGYPPRCSDPNGHEWPRVEESKRYLCVHCRADGDA